MMTIQANRVWDGKATLGEGPFWDETDHMLLWVDIEGYTLHCFNPDTKEDTTLPFAQHVTAVVKKEGGGLLLAMRDGIYSYSRDRLTPYYLHPDEGKKIRFNDAKCDPAGRLWAGTMAFDGKSPIGELVVLDTKERITKKIDGLAISNGMAWDTKQRLFYHNETVTGETTIYRYSNESIDIEKVGIVPINYRTYGGGPDGMTIDNEGYLWVALWGAGAVIRVDPITGNVDKKIIVPASNVTSCTFGGQELKTLYITTAAKEGERESGALFSVELEVGGAPSYPYKPKLLNE
ncbi:SMP-30/gluconolactonase/LRE family protein [Shouchella patagoniensis]|uniref:SMP-30/gluconolactonase/LRE family protein n=1 Tax=Shouchella patagoniensis TaxID=228576 RepID=UPI000994F211|nr:SMP-30/gluconolactonase/LRE family protein [Shouchella patagoniensis]